MRKRTTASMHSTAMLNPFSKGQEQRWVGSLEGGGQKWGKECSSERLQEHRTPRGWQVPGIRTVSIWEARSWPSPQWEKLAEAKWAGVSLELPRTAELGGVTKEIRII